jgi:hypothetical protein
MEQKSLCLHQLFIELKLVNASVTKHKDLVDKSSNKLSLYYANTLRIWTNPQAKPTLSKKEENLKI